MLVTTKTLTKGNISWAINERNKLEVLLKENYKISKIAKILNRHRTTIYREIKRINGEYYSENAQEDANTKSANKGRNSKITAELKNLIEDRLCKTWSPEQIVGRELKGRLSFKTIYNWLYSNFLDVSVNVLRRKGRRAKTEETRGKFNIGKSIDDRPEEVKKKEVFGHWELDSVVSARGESKACFATFVELKTRFYVAIKMKNRSKSSMPEAIRQLAANILEEAFRTFTSDRGKEFSCWEEVEKMGIEFYFADPYCSWQRGCNENSNGLLREFYPKKTDISKTDTEDLIRTLMLINSRPRKCLNYATPFEKFLHEISFKKNLVKCRN